MQCKLIEGAVLAALVSATLAVPGRALADSSSLFDATGMTVLIHRGGLQQFSGSKHPVDNKGSIACKSAAGCDLSVSSSIGVLSGFENFYIYTVVDGKKASPDTRFEPHATSPGAFLESVFDLAQGTHIVQTFILVTTTNGRTGIFHWQINYTMYDK